VVSSSTPDLATKASVLCVRIVKNHPLRDGNKPVGFLYTIDALTTPVSIKDAATATKSLVDKVVTATKDRRAISRSWEVGSAANRARR